MALHVDPLSGVINTSSGAPLAARSAAFLGCETGNSHTVATKVMTGRKRKQTKGRKRPKNAKKGKSMKNKKRTMNRRRKNKMTRKNRRVQKGNGIGPTPDFGASRGVVGGRNAGRVDVRATNTAEV